MSEFREFLEEQLQDPEFRKEWDTLEPEFAIVQFAYTCFFFGLT